MGGFCLGAKVANLVHDLEKGLGRHQAVKTPILTRLPRHFDVMRFPNLSSFLIVVRIVEPGGTNGFAIWNEIHFFIRLPAVVESPSAKMD